MRNNTNKGIACNVKGCIFNEGGQGCNLDKVKISKGEGNQHFCNSFISLQDENEYNFSLDRKLNLVLKMSSQAKNILILENLWTI